MRVDAIAPERWNYLKRNWLDLLILIGAALSLAGSYGDWSALEWTLRLGYVVLIFIRIVLFVIPLLTPSGILPVIALGALLLAFSGAVFYWLEPNVHSYADGLWLAFVTSATVGYGDLFPTTPASRIFAVFIVLLGYAVISLLIASIAALFIGEDERALRREMHRDIRALREEVAALRTEIEKRSHRNLTRGVR